MAAPNVKFPSKIRQGMKGKGVLSHKRAISRARPDLYPWHDFTDYAGDIFFRAVIQWKQDIGLNTQPIIGRVAHERLEKTHSKTHPKEWAFDATAIKLAAEAWQAHQVPPDKKVRKEIVDAAFYWYSHRMSIHYSMARPFQVGKPLWVPSRWDCSAFVTNCWYAGGAKDPNGRNYDHQGYTGTLIENGTKVSNINDLEPADLCFYGRTTHSVPGFPAGSPTHVAIYAGVYNGTHMVLSNGHYPMGFYKYDYRGINQMRHYKV